MSDSDQQARQSDPATAEHPVPQTGRENASAQVPVASPDVPWPEIGSRMLQQMILSAMHDMLAPVLGDGIKLVLVVDTGVNLHVISGHDDTWGVFDELTCADEGETIETSIVRAGKLLN